MRPELIPPPTLCLEALVSLTSVASALGLHRNTIRRALAAGNLQGIRISTRHYADERPKAQYGNWRISIDSVDAWLARSAGDTTQLRSSARAALLVAARRQLERDADHDHITYMPGVIASKRGGGGQ